MLLAITIAPTAWAHLGEPWVFPAVWMLRVLWWEVPDRLTTFFVLGAGPIILVAAMIFGFWTSLHNKSWMRIYVSIPGRIALPMIVVAALCFLDSSKATDYEPLSWLVFKVLSFPLGLFVQWIATEVTLLMSPGNWPLTLMIRWIVGFMGTALNIYMLAVIGVFIFRKPRNTSGVIVRGDDFQRPLDEHHKSDG